jgi:hypothetical protein
MVFHWMGGHNPSSILSGGSTYQHTNPVRFCSKYRLRSWQIALLNKSTDPFGQFSFLDKTVEFAYIGPRMKRACEVHSAAGVWLPQFHRYSKTAFDMRIVSGFWCASSVLLLLLPAGCHDITSICAEHASVSADTINMFDDFSQLQMFSDRATIDSAAVDTNDLFLWVTYGGGCREHMFRLYGWTAFLESYPPQAEIYLSHNSDNDLCKALIRDILRFNLTPLKHVYQRYYGRTGTILLRICPPGLRTPISPYARYSF